MDALQQMQAQVHGEMKAQYEGDGAQVKYGCGESTELQPQALYGYALLENRRGHDMEDFHVAEFREVGDGDEVGLFAIFDSHCGPQVGRQLQRRLFDNILNEGGVWADPAGATRDGYLLTDRQLLESGSGAEIAGSTAVTAMLFEHGSRLIVANVGDSRAVLCKNGKAVQLSVDHDLGRPVERANVEIQGGVVTTLPGRVANAAINAFDLLLEKIRRTWIIWIQSPAKSAKYGDAWTAWILKAQPRQGQRSLSTARHQECCQVVLLLPGVFYKRMRSCFTLPDCGFHMLLIGDGVHYSRHDSGDVPRVDGQIALARAFGDKALKKHMSAKPDMSDHLVDLSCEFLILASNGLCSVIPNQEAVDIVKSIIDPAKAAQRLIHQARGRLSDDDISCIVIRFHEQ